VDPQALLPLVASVLLWLTGARWGRSLPPATAVRVLTLTALVTALATGFVLAVAAFIVAAQVPRVAAFGHWSPTALRAGGAVPTVLGAVAGMAVLLLMLLAVRRSVRAGRDIAAAAVLCRRLAPDAGGLVIIEDDLPEAYALPGIGGRIVVSTAMLRALSAQERRVLLAHETAHLTHRHHAYVQTAELAAAANPLLRPVAKAVHAAVERWADEVAAGEVGDRHLAARALARAGLARAAVGRPTRQSVPAAALSAVGGDVADRARALLGPVPRHHHALASAIIAIAIAASASAVVTAHETEHRFERASIHYHSATTSP
jgi:Zn-dependent protease with chaperone function